MRDEIQRVVEQVARLKKEAADLSSEADKRKNAANYLLREVLPELLSQAGLKSVDTDSGTRVTVKDIVLVQPLAADAPKILSWLESRGDGALIKREASIPLGKDSARMMQALVAALMPLGLKIGFDCWVEPQTLKAHVRKLVAAKADDLPSELRLDLFREAKVEDLAPSPGVFSGEGSDEP